MAVELAYEDEEYLGPRSAHEVALKSQLQGLLHVE